MPLQHTWKFVRLDVGGADGIIISMATLCNIPSNGKRSEVLVAALPHQQPLLAKHSAFLQAGTRTAAAAGAAGGAAAGACAVGGPLATCAYLTEGAWIACIQVQHHYAADWSHSI